ncbi:preprotein translocase subunit SecE [Patescibacteria group bacterium]
MKGVVKFLSGIKLELTKVTWPTKQEVLRLTLIVFAISAIIGLYVGGLDFVFTKLLGLIISK